MEFSFKHPEPQADNDCSTPIWSNIPGKRKCSEEEPSAKQVKLNFPTMKVLDVNTSMAQRTVKAAAPKSPVSTEVKYKGVTQHRNTLRMEAHLWQRDAERPNTGSKGRRRGKQVYLGGFETAVEAAMAYDRAAIVFFGADEAETNFPIAHYADELSTLQAMSRDEIVNELKRGGTGFSRGASQFRGVTRHNNQFEARIGNVRGQRYMYLGRYDTQRQAAAVYDHAVLTYRAKDKVVTNFPTKLYYKPGTEELLPLEEVLEKCLSWEEPSNLRDNRLRRTGAPSKKPSRSKMTESETSSISLGNVKCSVAAAVAAASEADQHDIPLPAAPAVVPTVPNTSVQAAQVTFTPLYTLALPMTTNTLTRTATLQSQIPRPRTVTLPSFGLSQLLQVPMNTDFRDCFDWQPLPVESAEETLKNLMSEEPLNDWTGPTTRTMSLMSLNTCLNQYSTQIPSLPTNLVATTGI